MNNKFYSVERERRADTNSMNTNIVLIVLFHKCASYVKRQTSSEFSERRLRPQLF